MWNLGNRDIIVLLSVISGCVILCNACGPFYAITITLLLVICMWFTYVVADDTPFTLQALLTLDYFEEAGREINAYLEYVYLFLRNYFTDVASAVKLLYRVHVLERMAHRRRSTYQLSAETYPSPAVSRFSMVAGLSPIARGTFPLVPGNSNEENSPHVRADSTIFRRAGSTSKITSTPLVPWRKEESRNGDIFGSEHASAAGSPWGKSTSSLHQNHTLSRGDDVSYSAEGSPWGTSISPKMRARAGGVKTVQTVAGPLLASTRYNIDPKVYSDITSPGLTSRLAKYATEANTKLTHQSQYGTGQFPRVNLNSSPTPLINTKTGKMRTPVTVRVAPPENTRYSPPERQNILSEICQPEVKAAPSVVQVLKEISLKRHASREDVAFELVKKQRTEGVLSDGLENLEEMTQKRARDESPRSDEEISPQKKALRPAKRTKMPSCHDILSSLSSSINVSSGVKRKAIDISRSGSPDIGKHFKSLDPNHEDGGIAAAPPATVSRAIAEQMKSNKRALSESDLSRTADFCSPNKKLLETAVPPKSILKSPPKKQTIENASGEAREKLNRAGVEGQAVTAKEIVTKQPQPAVKLTDRLFMKAEPQNIEKLKSLIEEHGSIKPRFVTNESDEIKKSDIVNMRQTSMKSRLKSMFEAISGKAPSAINPKVVIQAEEPKVSTPSSTITATLSSSTLTTNINTSPIATTAVVPIIGKTKSNAATPAKHVTFQFSPVESTAKTDSTDTAKVPIVQTKPASVNVTEPKKIESPVVTDKQAATISAFPNFDTPSATTSAPVSAPMFSFTSPSLNTSTPATTNLTQPPTAIAATTSASVPSAAAAVTTSLPLFNSSSQIFNVSSAATSIFASPLPTVAKTTASALPNFNNTSQTPVGSCQPPAASFLQSRLSESTGNLGPQGVTVTATGTSELSTIANRTTAATPAPFSSATSSLGFVTTPATTSMFSFGGNSTTPQTTEKSGFSSEYSRIAAQPITFGSTTTSQPATTSTAAPPTASTGFNFNASSTKSSGIFGSAPTPATSSTASTSAFPAATTTAAFSFGSNSAGNLKPSFSFGGNTTSVSATATPVNAPASITFGTTSNNSAPLFGAPLAATSTVTTTSSPQPSLFGTPATSAVGFPKSTIALAFGTSNGQSTFAGTSNTSSTFGTPKTMETPTFGTTNASSPASFATASTASSLFGGGGGGISSNANATNSTSAAVLPSFGTSGFGETKPPQLAFGTSASSNFPSTSSTSLFGSPPTTNSTFGTPNPPTTGGSTPLFGTPSAPAQTFGTPSTAPPAFGASNTATTSFGVPSTSAVPSFGVPSTSVSSFGAISSTSAPAFGGLQSSSAATSGNQNSSNSVFSVTSNPVFGAVTTAPPAFGTTVSSSSGFGNSGTTGFGAPSNPAPPAFISTTSASFSGFGSSSNSATPFGSQPNAAGATSTFGTSNSAAPNFGSNTGNSSSSFTFGAAQPAAQQQPQQSAVFAFGAGGSAPNANNTASGSSAPFQFGNATPQTSGFSLSGAPQRLALNFSRDGSAEGSFAAPSLGANAFSAPTTGGMFSIGSGSTGPRSRPSRRRQR